MSKSKRGRQKRRNEKGRAMVASQAAAATAVVEDARPLPASEGAESPALPAWKLRLPAIGLRIGIYALYLLGIYWILAAWFSSWGDTFWGCIGLTGLGVGLIFVAMNVNSGEYSREDLPSAAGRNIREGAIWCVGGIVLTRLGYLGYLPIVEGGRYIVFTGAILFGFLQLLQGCVQWQLAKKPKYAK